MKIINLTSFLLLLVFNSYSQEIIHCMSFIHSPTVTKTPSPVYICVEKIIKPSNDISDSFIVGIKTDMKTFKELQNFIKKNKYIVRGSFKLYKLKKNESF